MMRFFSRLGPFLLAACLGTPLANATSTVPPPVIRTYVIDASLAGLGDQQLFAVPATSGRTLAMGSSFERVAGSPLIDVYVGVILPGGRVFTWVPKPGGGAILTEGFSPVARSVAETTFTTRAVFGADASHTFSDKDATGLYSVFTLLVGAGRDPGDARQWSWVNMVPLMFQGFGAPAVSK